MIDIINCKTAAIILATNIQIKKNDIQNQLVKETRNETKKETIFSQTIKEMTSFKPTINIHTSKNIFIQI